ncbi:MAG: glycosyltransferase [Sphingomonadaceae bacterium]
MSDGSEKPLVSVVIPCRSHALPLSACLTSLADQKVAGGYEVIVVDSAADPAVSELCSRFPSVRLIRRSEGLLAGAARNLGAAQARGDYLAFIDADCIAEPGWIAAIINALRSGAKLVGGAVLHGRPWHPVAVIDNQMQFASQAPGRPAGAEMLIPSCNIAMRRSDFEAVGGFPRTEQPTGEDGIFCQRVAARWPDQTMFAPTARIRHFGRETLRQFCVHQYRFGHVRGVLLLNLTPFQRKLGRHLWMMPLVALKRLIWLTGRAVKWDRPALVKMLLYFPILILGLAAWSLGFRNGCVHGDEILPSMDKASHAAE